MGDGLSPSHTTLQPPVSVCRFVFVFCRQRRGNCRLIIAVSPQSAIGNCRKAVVYIPLFMGSQPVCFPVCVVHHFFASFSRKNGTCFVPVGRRSHLAVFGGKGSPGRGAFFGKRLTIAGTGIIFSHISAKTFKSLDRRLSRRIHHVVSLRRSGGSPETSNRSMEHTNERTGCRNSGLQ